MSTPVKRMKRLCVLASSSLLALLAAGTAFAQTQAERDAISALEPAVDVGNRTVTRSDPAPDASAAPAPAAGRRGRASDSLDLGTTSITGNQELPKVLYIVPWKSSDLGELVGRPVSTLLDEVLAPIDPEVFERHLDYYGILYGEGRGGETPSRGRGREQTDEE